MGLLQSGFCGGAVSFVAELIGGAESSKLHHIRLPTACHAALASSADPSAANLDHPCLLLVLVCNADGTAAGVFLLSSNGMDVELQQTSMTYR